MELDYQTMVDNTRRFLLRKNGGKVTISIADFLQAMLLLYDMELTKNPTNK